MVSGLLAACGNPLPSSLQDQFLLLPLLPTQVRKINT